MKYTTPIQNYVRSSVPPNPQSQTQWLNEELQKLERALATITQALAQIATKVT